MPRYLLDITRTLSRIGRDHPTGIDRVERHYFDYIRSFTEDPLFIARMGDENFLLDLGSAQKIRKNLDSPDGWGPPNLRDRARLKLPYQLRAARSFVRKEALRRSSSVDLEKLLPVGSLDDYIYLNIGHSNLNDKVFKAVKSAGGNAAWVFVHDMIPLEYPEFTRPGVSGAFGLKMKAVSRNADRILTNSNTTEEAIKQYFGRWGRTPETCVAHLGTEKLDPHERRAPDQPFFVVLGTIEPRKNHATLFRCWEILAERLPKAQVPRLLVIGQRGWNNEEVFRFLDSSPLMNKHIFEMNDVSDSELAGLLAYSRALLFPSHVEGYGMPALEAMSLSVPVLCSEISIFKELLEGYGTFLKPLNAQDWAEEIEKRTKNPSLRQNGNRNGMEMPPVPTWDAHFRHVFQRP